MKKNILIATGGSGGHITPAMVLYSHLKKKFNLFISSDLRGLKYTDLKEKNFFVIDTPNIFSDYILIPIKLIAILILTIKSIFFLINKKIDIILSTGGYAPVPLCLAGIFLGKKLFVYEPNQVLGKSNKFFLFFCYKIFCHAKPIKNYPNKFKKKILLLSPLVRKFFYKDIKKKDKRFTLMIIGGSQGAKVFDKFLHEILLKISDKIKFKVYHQTKINNIKFLRKFYNKNNISHKVFNFDINFIDMIKNCDFCITRAGASTLSELFILKIPFLAIPLPNSKDNHQFENAKYYKDLNCSWLFNEKQMNENKLYKLLKKIILDKKNLKKKRKSIIKLNKNVNWLSQNKIIIRALNES